MSCCPLAPPAIGRSDTIPDSVVQETDIRKGESVECYDKRVGNTTGLQDDATDNALDKIDNTAVPINCQASVDVTFKLTEGSTQTVTTWEMKDKDGNPISNFPGGVTFDGATGRLAGTFATSQHGKQIKITIEAKNGSTLIDSRGFTFSPALCNSSNSIELLHPLPGAIVNSKFGPRMHPIHKVMKMHKGLDFKFADRSTADVRSAADGVITFAAMTSGGYGNSVRIKHSNGSGVHLCTTTYNHLAKIYVVEGQKLTAGQPIGREGTTGASTGNHLHFECILPNGTFVDPEPYIRGSLSIAQSTLPNGDGTNVVTRSSGVSLTAENVRAKEGGCEPFGPDYPKDPTDTQDPVPPITDPFEKAWFFTMTHEVGPHWPADPQTDTEIVQGLIDTSTQRKKVGYVNSENFPGGETKFGIAQGPNSNIKVTTINYESAKSTGFNNYWKRGPSSLIATMPKTAIMLFDMNYLHGVGNANYIRSNANISGLADADACIALQASQERFLKGIVEKNPQRSRYINGWIKRSKDLLAYAQST